MLTRGQKSAAKLVEYLLDHPSSSVEDIAKGLGRSIYSVGREIDQLMGVCSIEVGLVETNSGSLETWYYSLDVHRATKLYKALRTALEKNKPRST